MKKKNEIQKPEIETISYYKFDVWHDRDFLKQCFLFVRCNYTNTDIIL